MTNNFRDCFTEQKYLEMPVFGGQVAKHLDIEIEKNALLQINSRLS